ncbi:MAG: endonuclease Q family protein [Patescibacteria group bacterium]
MRQVLDLHIHSRYSRACSPKLNLENIEAACRIKGVDIIGTGDFTYHAWFEAIKKELKETFHGSGLYKLKIAADDKVKFILSSEVALIYKDEEKVRRIHLVIHAPNIRAAEKLNKLLDKNYNIRSDGRPILGIKAPEFIKILLNIDSKFLVYPAHIWTPWFSVFGSKSGFNNLEECFKDQVKNIFAYETGLSSDPEMNWRLSRLDKLTMLSSSDAHSLNNIAREATVMEISEPVTYEKIYQNIKNKKNIIETIEFYPEEGVYHLDGHRSCNFSCEPGKSKKLKNICPVCKKPLVIGVLNRVEELADRPRGYKPKNAPSFKKLVELDKIIAESLGIKNRASIRVRKVYIEMIKTFGSELDILLNLDLKKMHSSEFNLKIVEGIKRVRDEKLIIKPGFDGQYGEINLFNKN